MLFMDYKKLFDRILWYFIIPFTALSFITVKLTNDTRIFIGVEAIADRFYSFPYGWDSAYEVKPIGNRIWNWIFYKFADFFSPMILNHYTEFGWFIKGLALIILIVCCYYISKKIVFPYAFPILFISFACEANFGLLMSEWWGALFSLVAVAMVIGAKPSDNPLSGYVGKGSYWKDTLRENGLPFLAGIFFIFIGLLKGITILLIIPTVCAVYLLGYKIKWVPAIVGFLSGGFAFISCCFAIWPYAISDILLSRLVAHVGQYDPITLIYWFWITQARTNLPMVMGVYLPAVLIGAFAGLWGLLHYCSKGKYKQAFLFSAMWLCPIVMIFIQSEFIVYHYCVLLVPSIISIVILLKTIKPKWQTALVIIGLIFAGYLVINSAIGSYSIYEYTFWHQKEIDADTINAQFDLINQTSILYLDPGDAPYYFQSNSSCRYIAPMPVERSTPEWNITYTDAFKEDYACILAYQGDYIVADISSHQDIGYFGEGIADRKSIMDMIANNYTKVSDNSWAIYERKGLVK